MSRQETTGVDPVVSSFHGLILDNPRKAKIVLTAIVTFVGNPTLVSVRK